MVIQGADFASGRLAKRVEELFEHWRESEYRDGRRGFELLIDTLAHDLEIRTPLSLAVDEADREIIRWSDRQYVVLDMLARQRRVAVSGPAGSGKTLMAVEKARRLANEGFRTLLCCYNRPLRDALHELPALKDVENLEVFTFDQFCWHLAIRGGLQKRGLSLPERGSRALSLDEIACPRCEAKPLFVGRTVDGRFWLYGRGRQARLCKERPGLPSVSEMLEGALTYLLPEYDAIVVDEAQDFGEEWWLPLQLLSREADEGILYVFYDSNQAIYGRPPGLPEDLAPDHPGGELEEYQADSLRHDAVL